MKRANRTHLPLTIPAPRLQRGAKEDRQAPGELIQVPKPAVQKWAAYSIEEWLPNGCKASLKEISFTWRSKLWQTKGTMANPWSPQVRREGLYQMQTDVTTPTNRP